MDVFIVKPWGDGVEDSGRGASTVPKLEQPRIDPPHLPSLEVKISQEEHFGKAVVDYEIKI